MNIEHSAEFGFQAILDYKIGEQYTGKYANLFYVVGDGTFEYLGGPIVDENGVASFVFTHASDYIIAITDVEYTGQKLNDNPTDQTEEVQTESASDDGSESSKTEEDVVETPKESQEFHEENELHEQEKTSEESVSQEEIVPEEEKTSVVAVDSDGKNIWIMISCVVLAIVVILGIVFIKKKK